MIYTRNKALFFIVIAALIMVFGGARYSSAELVTHKGLPNEEGVKGDPLKEGFFSPDLPNRDGVEIGPVTAHTAFTHETQFDTNVFLEDDGENFDVITILRPFVGLDMKLGDNNANVEYEAAINLFSRFEDQSYVDQRLRGMAEINLADYKVTIANVYRYFSDRAGSEDVDRIRRQNNYMRAGLIGLFDQLQFEAGYTFGVEDFISDDVIFRTPTDVMTYDSKDRLLNIFDAQASYRFMPKTSFLVENYFGLIDYKSDKNADSWFVESLVGLRGDLRENFSADITMGVRFQDYDDATMTDSDDYVGFVMRGGATYEFTEDDILNLLVERNIYESTFNNMNYYNINHIGGSYTHFFTKKTTSRVFSYYQLNLYPDDTTVAGDTDERRDHLYAIGGALRYDMKKWASMEVKYEHKVRRSNFDVFDYVDNLVTMRGTIGF
jgi:hypothetical protein